MDSLTRQEMDITPFKNILNDMYSRDISKKVLAGRMTRSRPGKFCGGQPPLGLMRDPEDKGHLIREPETAPVIRKIYEDVYKRQGVFVPVSSLPQREPMKGVQTA